MTYLIVTVLVLAVNALMAYGGYRVGKVWQNAAQEEALRQAQMHLKSSVEYGKLLDEAYQILSPADTFNSTEGLVDPWLCVDGGELEHFHADRWSWKYWELRRGLKVEWDTPEGEEKG